MSKTQFNAIHQLSATPCIHAGLILYLTSRPELSDYFQSLHKSWDRVTARSLAFRSRSIDQDQISSSCVLLDVAHEHDDCQWLHRIEESQALRQRSAMGMADLSDGERHPDNDPYLGATLLVLERLGTKPRGSRHRKTAAMSSCQARPKTT